MSANNTPDATATPRTQAFLCSSRNEDDISAFMETLERELTAAKAQLRERTQWQCKCGGKDCAGQAENERLRAEVERLRNWHRARGAATEQAKKEIAELEQALRMAAIEAHKVRELEADKARLEWLEKSFNDDPIAKVPTWFSVFCDVAQEGPHPAPGQSLRAAIDAARAGKGAT